MFGLRFLGNGGVSVQVRVRVLFFGNKKKPASLVVFSFSLNGGRGGFSCAFFSLKGGGGRWGSGSGSRSGSRVHSGRGWGSGLGSGLRFFSFRRFGFRFGFGLKPYAPSHPPCHTSSGGRTWFWNAWRGPPHLGPSYKSVPHLQS